MIRPSLNVAWELPPYPMEKNKVYLLSATPVNSREGSGYMFVVGDAFHTPERAVLSTLIAVRKLMEAT